MGRPKRHATAADRQAAYRQRQRDTTVRMDRQLLDRVETRMAALQEAVAPLARQGDPFAQRVYRANLVTLLETLTAWFREQPLTDPLPRAPALGLRSGAPTRPRSESPSAVTVPTDG